MPAERKRPWYLVVALLVALGLGMTGAYDGWSAVATYHADPAVLEHAFLASAGIADGGDEAERTAATARFDEYIHVLDAEKTRGWPLAVATLLLGGATFLFAMRALGGSGGARAALVQLVAAQAAVGVAAHFLTRDVVEAWLRLQEAAAAAAHASGAALHGSTVPSLAMLRTLNDALLTLRTVATALVIVGLTLMRSRAYFDERTASAEGG
jgi:hypothetical protein